MDRFVTACETIVEKKGVRLDDFGRIQNGRWIEGCVTFANWAGAREKSAAFFRARAAGVKKERSADLRSGAE